MDHIDRSVDELTRAELSAHYVELQTRSAAVLARMLSGAESSQSDRILNIDELTVAMGVSRRWLFSHASRLPFVTRVSRRSLTGSEKGMRKWLANRRIAK